MGAVRGAVLEYAEGTLRLLPGQAAVTAAVFGGAPEALLERVPELVRGFAGERTDGGALFRAAAGFVGETADVGLAVGGDDGRGCAVVQSLPGLSRESAGSAMAARADRLAEAADRLHWELAEGGDVVEGGAAGRLAARYALCYVGAALLWLWRAGDERRSGWACEGVDAVLAVLEDSAACVPDVPAALALLPA
ncbi:hypothetical protein [Streptomyces sp. NPDC093089]|uniref:hypothetical protein n=1 Tax=Streptomyces sp. NPDC093089 TaxID=3366024 RepID=UPI0037F2375D